MPRSPLLTGLAAAALLLTLSPEARKTARKWAVKAAETALDLTEQTKDAAAGLKQQLQIANGKAKKGEEEDFPLLKK